MSRQAKASPAINRPGWAGWSVDEVAQRSISRGCLTLLLPKNRR